VANDYRNTDKSEEYLDLHLMPNPPDFWKIENYNKFLEEC
jgi:hypothetical protein